MTFIAFAQNARKIDSLDEYGNVMSYISGMGISTNYLGAMTLAENFLENDPNYDNYIVFMTDGGPTASQWPSFISDGDLNFVSAVYDFLAGNLSGAAAAVVGGWYGCHWVSSNPNKFVGDPLITNIVGINFDWLCTELGFSDAYAEWVWMGTNLGSLDNEYILPGGKAKAIGIMKQVNYLKGIESKGRNNA